MNAKYISAAAALVILALLAIVPVVMLKAFVLFQMSTVLAYSIAVLSLILLTGLNGQISLGNGAFFAIGGYGAAILVSHYGLPYWAAVPCSGVACLLVGYVIGIPAVKLEGLYLALATFSLAVVVPQILKYKWFAPWTGGFQGLVLDPPDVPDVVSLTPDQWLYLVCLFSAAACMLFTRNLLLGRYGRALEAIREHPIAASAMGIDVPSTKAWAFATSAMLAGLSGGLSVMLTQFVSPDAFNFFLSISLMVGAVIGGLTSIWGSLLGAAFIVFVPNISENISKAVPWAVYGVLLIAVVFLMPTGVAGLLAKAFKLTRRRGQAPALQRPGMGPQEGRSVDGQYR